LQYNLLFIAKLTINFGTLLIGVFMTAIVDTETSEGEISILDIYDFFATNLVTILIWVVVAIGAGAVVAFSLPVKYEASAVIEPTRIAETSTDLNTKALVFKSTVVESKEVLAEKLKSPTYYSDETIKACGFDSKDINPQLSLSKDLNA
jgi:hypothetical protein